MNNNNLPPGAPSREWMKGFMVVFSDSLSESLQGAVGKMYENPPVKQAPVNIPGAISINDSSEPNSRQPLSANAEQAATNPL